MTKALDKPTLDDTDYAAWLEEQMAHLRARRPTALDVVVADARRAAIIETRRSASDFPPAVPHTVEQILERELPAEELPEQQPVRKKL